MEDQLEKLASQLRCPAGEDGIALGQDMNMRNLSVILNGIANLNLQNGDTVLELGYGNGGLLGYILSLAENLHYTGLEISSAMHQQALSFNQAYIKAGLAEYLLYDGVTLPLEEKQFDKILTINTLYFWQDPIALFTHIHRSLKIHGLFCLTFCDKSFMEKLPFTKIGFKLYDVSEVKELVRDLPLKLVHEDRKMDKSISKTGSLVERKFISLVFEKTAR